MKPLLLALTFAIALTSCQVNNNPEAKQLANLSDSTSITGLTGDSVKLVKTAGIQCKVRNVEQSLKQLSALTAAHGGAVFHQVFSAVEEGRRELRLSTDSLLVISTIRPQADVTVRVPSTKLEAFLFAAADLGYYTANSNLQVDDKSLEYLANSLKTDIRNDAIESPVARKRKGGDANQTIAIADEAVNHFVAAKTIDAAANYSTINLSLFQNVVVRRETIANTALDGYNLPFTERLANAISSGWNAFLQFLLGVTHLWMFVLLGVTIFIFYRRLSTKSKPVVQRVS